MGVGHSELPMGRIGTEMVACYIGGTHVLVTLLWLEFPPYLEWLLRLPLFMRMTTGGTFLGR